MKKVFFIVVLSPLLFLYCTHSTTLSEQLKLNFSTHLKMVDSSLILDSFKIIRIDTMDQRLGRITDTMDYKRELHRVQGELANAIVEQKKDSIIFYKDEINYILPQLDSLTNSISRADTTKKFGIIVSCLFQIRKNNEYQKKAVNYFLDNKMNIRNSDMIDTVIQGAYLKLN
jgi:hypothetical protein